MEVTNKAYLVELKELKEKMIKAEAWAKKMPLFSENILEKKITGEENFLTYTKQFRDVYFQWGVNRSYYDDRRTITNYRGTVSGHFWEVYVNTYNLFDEHIDNGLSDIENEIPIFFFDKPNKTFYATDKQIEKLLEALNEWYNLTRIELKEISKIKEIENAKKEIARLQGLVECGI